MSTRTTEFSIDPMFTDRWSPRAFDPEYTMKEEDLKPLFEAARWSPSCFNEQPWRFCYGLRGDQEFELLFSLLVDANQAWAKDASALVIVTAQKYFSKNDKPNDHARFDSGAAWMAMALEARKRDLYTHGMAGVHYDEAYEKLNISKDKMDVICAVAVGKKGDKSSLPEKYQEMEEPNQRKALSEIIFKGKFS